MDDQRNNDSSNDVSKHDVPKHDAPKQNPPSPNYKALTTLAKVVQVFLGIVLLVLVLSAVGVIAVDVLARSGQIESVRSIILVLRVFDVVQPIVYLVSGVLFIVWMRRAFRNLSALNVVGTDRKEWQCVWGFFIPIVSLFIPMSVVNEIWKASNPAELDSANWKQSKDSRLVVSWWICYITYAILNLVRNVFTRLSRKDEVALVLSSPTGFLVLQAIFIAAGVLLILVVREITARQEKKYSLVHGNQASS